jgi:hypothetical protein
MLRVAALLVACITVALLAQSPESSVWRMSVESRVCSPHFEKGCRIFPAGLRRTREPECRFLTARPKRKDLNGDRKTGGFMWCNPDNSWTLNLFSGSGLIQQRRIGRVGETVR